MRELYLLLLGVFLLVKAAGQTGELDPSFANKGIQLASFSQNNRLSEQGNEVLGLADGKYLVVMQVTNSANYTTVTIAARYLFNGTIDSSYGQTGYSVPVNMSGASAILQGDKVIVAGTSFLGDFALARLNPDGSLDTGFGVSGLTTTDFSGSYDAPQSVIILNDHIFVAGNTTVGGSFNSNFALVSYFADGRLDSAFGENGLVVLDFGGKDDFGMALAVQQEKIIVAGYTVVIDSIGFYYRDDFAVARFHPNGLLDSSFGNNGLVTTDFDGGREVGQAVVIQGEKIMVAGYTTDFNTAAVQFAIARYNVDGSLDTSFSEDGRQIAGSPVTTYNYAFTMALQGDKFIIAGQASYFDSLFYTHDGFALLRFNSAGMLDSSFGTNGLVITDVGNFESANSILISENYITVAGTIGYGSDNDYAVARYKEDGGLDSSFSGDGLATGYFPSGETYFASLLMQGEKLLAAGNTNNTIYGLSSFAVARFNPNGSPDSSFNGTGMATTGFGNFSGIARSIALQGDKIVVAGYTYPLGDFALARYNTDGTADSSFGQNGTVTTDLLGWDDLAQSIVVYNNKLIVAGYAYNPTNFRNDFAIARYNSDGSLDSTFNGKGWVTTDFYTSDFSGSDDIAASLVIQDGKILVAGSTSGPLYYTTNFAIARYNENGRLDSSFGLNGWVEADFDGSNDYGLSIALQGSKIVVSGTSMSQSSFEDGIAIARFNADGRLDSSFNKIGRVTINLGAVDDGRSVVIQGDKIIVGGTVTNNPDSRKSFGIVRYNNDGSLDSSFSFDGLQVTGELGSNYYLGQIALYGNRLYATGSIEVNGLNTFGAVTAYQLEEKAVFSCREDTVTSTQGRGCTAIINNIDPVIAGGSNSAEVSYNLSGATTGKGTGSASGNSFNSGVTLVTYYLTSNPAIGCSFSVTVEDRKAPIISRAHAFPFIIWPVDGRMKTVTIGYSVHDNCETTVSLSVGSNEPQSTGRGDPSPDWEIIDDHHVRLRAETAAGSNGGIFPLLGRIYTIRINARDAAGNKTVKKLWVGVPRCPLFKTLDGKDEERPLKVSVMPNPSQSSFTLVLDGGAGKPFSLRVRDAQGRLIEDRKAITHNTVKLGDRYTAGMYYAEIIRGTSRVVVKLIKSR